MVSHEEDSITEQRWYNRMKIEYLVVKYHQTGVYYRALVTEERDLRQFVVALFLHVSILSAAEGF